MTDCWLWCAICSHIQKKNKCRIKTRISKAYATKCTLRWRFASAICWCKIYDFLFILCCCCFFFWLVTTQTIPKKHETHLIFAQMIYFLWFTCCSCYIVFALRFFLFLSVKCLGCVNTSFFHFFFLQSIALYCSFKVQRSKSSTG